MVSDSSMAMARVRAIVMKICFLVVLCLVLVGRRVESSVEIEALMEIKAALDPKGAILNSWVAEADPCSGGFEGVACDGNGKVANVSLQSKNLSGFLSPSFAKLRCLNGLYLHYNNLKGEIPKEISNLTELVDLYLNLNALSGSIPPELAYMSSLQVLQLCCNKLTGSIPSKLGSLKKLSFLALQHNQLTGAIPSSLGSIASLNRLDLSFNNLTGAIPQTLASLQQLTVLNLRSNRLSGRVPRGLKGLRQDFRYDNNSKLCGDGFSGLPGCNSSVPSSEQKPIGTATLNITSNPVVSVPKIPMPANVSASCKGCSLSSPNRSKIRTVSAIIAVLFTATISMAFLLFVWYRKEKQKIGSAFEVSDTRLSPDLFCNYSEDHSRKCPSPLILLEYSSDWDPLADRGTASDCFRFNLEEIESATHYFSDKSLLGRNGFASVYKGFLRDGSCAAVKCFSKTSCKTKEIEFQEGLDILMQIQHENLVKFRGFCCSNGRAECFLVYEFVYNGTLSHHLDGEAGRNLDWSTRVRIAYGVAKGIEYLHHGLPEPIVHQNISAANILLDQHLSPHLSDCALQRLFADDIVFSILKTSAAMGYLAPEYATVGRLTLESDIYAFGKILLQLLTGGRKDISHNNPSTSSAHRSVKTLVESGKVEEFMDPRLDGKYSVAEATSLAEIALACTSELASERPPMDTVVRRFETGINQERKT